MSTFQRIILAGLAVAALAFFLVPKVHSPDSAENPAKSPVSKQRFAPATRWDPTNTAALPSNPLNVVNLANLTPSEREELAKKFNEKFKPTVENWFKAYDNRLPFRLDALTLETFRSRMGRENNHLYTFVFDGITLVIKDANDSTKVMYMMTRKAATELNQLPANGFVPDFNLSVTREDVIRMVKADSGVEFKPNEVIMRPTAAGTAMNGGAFVKLLPTGADPENGLSSKIELVFGADGNLANYDRDPFF
jgi:hypothetical protein